MGRALRGRGRECDGTSLSSCVCSVCVFTCIHVCSHVYMCMPWLLNGQRGDRHVCDCTARMNSMTKMGFDLEESSCARICVCVRLCNCVGLVGVQGHLELS